MFNGCMEDVRGIDCRTHWNCAEGFPSESSPDHQSHSAPAGLSWDAPAKDAISNQAALQQHMGELVHRRKKSETGSLRGLLLAKYRSESTGDISPQRAASAWLPEDPHSSQHLHTGELFGGLQMSGCGLCGTEDAAAWFDVDSLLQQVQHPMERLFSGHESDESGCSASSRISSQQMHTDLAACMPNAQPNSHSAQCSGERDLCVPSASAACDSLDAPLPSQGESAFSEEDLLMCLDVACRELGVTGEQPAALGADTSWRSCDAALSTAACLPTEAHLQAPLLRASSSNSRAGISSAACAAGTQKMASGSLSDLRMQQQSAPSGQLASGSGQRKRGRPRRYDTTLPLLPGAMEAQASAALAGHINGVDSEKRKRTRGAKPKYQFLTAEEAIAHRRERNRLTALASYEKRKARENALRSQITQLEQEQAALKQLLGLVQQPVVDIGMVRDLLLTPDASVCAVLDLCTSSGVAGNAPQ